MTEDDGGWTTIPSKSNPKQKSRLPPPSTDTSTILPRSTSSAASSTSVPRPDPTLTLPLLLKSFHTTRARFLRSSCHSSLKALLSRLLPSSHPDDGDDDAVDTGSVLRRAYCLGSGSFSRENVEQRGRSLLQLVVFLEVAGMVGGLRGRRGAGGEGREGMGLVAVEPRYTALDGEFLAELGVEVVGRDAGGDHGGGGGGGRGGAVVFGGDCVVCEFFVEWKVGFLRRFLDDGVGIVLGSMRVDGKALGEEVQKLKGKDELTPEEDYLVTNERFCREFQAYYFPRYEEDPNVLEGLKVAVRRSPDDEV